MCGVVLNKDEICSIIYVVNQLHGVEKLDGNSRIYYDIYYDSFIADNSFDTPWELVNMNYGYLRRRLSIYQKSEEDHCARNVTNCK